MNPEDSRDLDLIAHYRSEVSRVVAGVRWIVADSILVGGANVATKLLELGAEAVLVIACSRGTGDLPEDPRLKLMDFGINSADMQSSIRDSEEFFRNLPKQALRAIEEFDPAGEALASGVLWLSCEHIAGRPMLGARPEAWRALEDKMVADALWARAGIAHAPYRLVDAELSALRSAAAEVSGPLGTVWVGDNKEGWHGGANMTRWVRDEADAVQTAAFLGKHCDRVRVMPFLEGLPCSIHAFVTADAVAPIHPCEMLVFRTEGSNKLHYAGASTNWVPSPEIGAQMRDAVQRVGEQIQREVGYRGSFTLDGVCTSTGFYPTEINPRYGGALGRMSSGFPDLPLYLLHQAMASEKALDFRPHVLAKLVAGCTTANPVIKGMALLTGQREIEPAHIHLIPEGQNWLPTEDSDNAVASIRLGPSPAGSIIFCQLNKGVIPHGDPAAPIVASLLNYAFSYWNVEHLTLIPNV